MNSEKQYIELYRQHRDLVTNHSCEVMNACRESAATLLSEQGLPTHKTERYKYTNADEAFAPNYGVNIQRIVPKVNAYDTFKCNVPNLSTSLFFVVNDTVMPAPQSSYALLPEGVNGMSLFADTITSTFTPRFTARLRARFSLPVRVR